jgi:hypothetical protein
MFVAGEEDEESPKQHNSNHDDDVLPKIWIIQWSLNIYVQDEVAALDLLDQQILQSALFDLNVR